jgi:hypothetical protein
VAIDEQHVALPKLYGAPAYARPPRHVSETDRPFNLDDLPIEIEQTDEEKDLLSTMPARSYAAGGAVGQIAAVPATPSGRAPELQPKPTSLKALAGRILGGDS